MLKGRGIDPTPLIDTIKSDDPAWDEFWSRQASMNKAWTNAIQNDSIYRIFKEGTHDRVYKAIELGHPEDNWDELVTSVLNVSLAYPESLKSLLAQLPVHTRVAAETLIGQSLDMLAGGYPPDEFPELQAAIKATKELLLAP
jgi:hypothetical protein